MRTREEIKAKIQKWQDRLDNFKTELEVGKWYKTPKYGSALFCVTNIDNEDVEAYGFNMYNSWTKKCFGFAENSLIYNILATDQEVETALIKEAKKRGFKEGIEFNSPNAEHHYAFNQKIINCDFLTWDKDLTVRKTSKNVNGIIFSEGKWAEIIESTPEYTMQELTEKLGYTFKIKK